MQTQCHCESRAGRERLPQPLPSPEVLVEHEEVIRPVSVEEMFVTQSAVSTQEESSVGEGSVGEEWDTEDPYSLINFFKTHRFLLSEAAARIADPEEDAIERVIEEYPAVVKLQTALQADILAELTCPSIN